MGIIYSRQASPATQLDSCDDCICNKCSCLCHTQKIVGDMMTRTKSPAISFISRNSSYSDLGVMVEKPIIGSPPDMVSMLMSTTPKTSPITIPSLSAVKVHETIDSNLSSLKHYSTKKVLVIDINPFMKKVYETLLHTHDYQVDYVSSGSEALSLLGSQSDCNASYGAIFVADNTYPIIETIIENVREIVPSLKIVAVLSHSSQHLKAVVHEASVEHILVKPIKSNCILQILDC